LIETMLAVAIFTLLVTMGIGAVLAANSNYQNTQNLRAITDNLNFIMEDMAKNIRLASSIRCAPLVADYNGENIEIPADCVGGGASIAFEPFRGKRGTFSDQWVYRIDTTAKKIQKSIDGGQNFSDLTDPAILSVNTGRSGFWVFGAEGTGDGDTEQPRVVIRLSGSIIYKGKVSEFNLQTTVAQRNIDL